MRVAKAERQVSLRILVISPAPGVMYALQREKADLVQQVKAGEGNLTFELTVRVGGAGEPTPNFLGPFVQGPKGARFVYINSGTMAGQKDSCWTRRAKVRLQGI